MIEQKKKELLANNAINTDHKKLRCAPLFVPGYGWRYV